MQRASAAHDKWKGRSAVFFTAGHPNPGFGGCGVEYFTNIPEIPLSFVSDLSREPVVGAQHAAPCLREADALQWVRMRIWLALFLFLALSTPGWAQRLEVEAPASLEPLAVRLRSLDPAKLEGAA